MKKQNQEIKDIGDAVTLKKSQLESMQYIFES